MPDTRVRDAALLIIGVLILLAIVFQPRWVEQDCTATNGAPVYPCSPAHFEIGGDR